MTASKPAVRTEMADFLELAHRLADLSAERILPHFRNLESISNKAEGAKFDPVTVADREAERVIRETIAQAYPGHGIVGEEFGESGGNGEHQWFIDPIDGTRAFVLGSPLWGTLIGLLASGRPALGLMNQPFTGERFWGAADGARYWGPDGERVLKTRACPTLEAATLTTTSPDLFGDGFERERFEAVSQRVHERRFGGDCYGYCLLAAGHLDLVIEAGLQPYDIVALIPIVERAGGRVTQWDGSDASAGGRIVASGDPKLHDAVLKILGSA